MIVKICGITNTEDAAAAVEGGAGALGFNFYRPSPRYIEPQTAAEIETPDGVLRAGVFVGESPERVRDVARVARLDVVQLHGDEQAEDFAGLRVWKSVRIEAGFQWAAMDGTGIDALLLDGPAGALFGGSGKTFDWERFAGQAKACPARLIVAGGLDETNVARAVELLRPWGVDACSRIESAPGKKDLIRMSRFLAAAKAALCI